MKFILPNIGEGIDTMSITEILVKKGEKVKNDTPILLVETDKASMEIPIDCDCIITAILVKEGDLISPGQTIMEIDKINDKEKKLSTNDEDKNNISKTENIEEIEENKKAEMENNVEKEIISNNNIIHATPSARKLARESQINIEDIKSKEKRVTEEDVYQHIKKNTPISKKEINLSNTLSKWGLVEEIKLTSNQIKTGTKLHESWNSIPHVTQFDECDITNLYKLVKLLKNVNKNEISKVSYVPFFIKTVSYILKEFKIFNSSLNTDKKSIIQKHYYNIGFAIDTDEGLVVPVIKNTDKKSIKRITIEFNQLIKKAREKKLTIDDISGGCFTISSLGNIGGNFFTPIINPPEVAILGVSKINTKPILKDKKFIARKILPLSLSYDHRVINGADAVKFTKMFSTIIESPEKL